MVSVNNSINDKVGASIPGATNSLTITNSSNTASSAALKIITVGGASSGDPTTNFNISGITDWEMGIDNNDSDNLKISQSTSLGINDTWIMNTSGTRTMPLQPYVFAEITAAANNITGDGTVYVYGDTDVGPTSVTIFEQGSNYTAGASGGAYFTAPVTGKYLLGGTLFAEAYTAAMGIGQINLVTSNGGCQMVRINVGNVRNAYQPDFAKMATVLLDMDAMDIFQMTFMCSGGAKVVDLRSVAAPRNNALWATLLI